MPYSSFIFKTRLDFWIPILFTRIEPSLLLLTLMLSFQELVSARFLLGSCVLLTGAYHSLNTSMQFDPER